MPTIAAGTVVRDLLTRDLTLSADAVIKMAQARGVRAPERTIREAVYSIRSELRKKGAGGPAESAARPGKGQEPEPAPVEPPAAQTPDPAPGPAAAARAIAAPPPDPTPAPVGPDLAAIFATVNHVNAVVVACGGVENARQVLDAVRACGGTEATAQYLDLVAGMRAASKPA